MFYLAEKPSKFGQQFDRWIFVPLSPDARKFILEHPLVREGKGVKVDQSPDETSTLWELDWAAATDITQDALTHRLKVITPDKLNYLKAILK